MQTYMDWDREVLQYMGELADYISLHRYVGNPANDTASYLAVTASVDRQIEEMDAACRFVQARNRGGKRAFLCFDEWNVWYRARGGNGEGKIAPPLLEEVYNLEDALVVAGFLNSFIRHADVVKVANLAQIVNVIAPVLTRDDGLLIQSIFYPFEMMSKRRDGVSLRLAVDGPCYDGGTHGSVNTIDGSAILGEGALHLFVTNRDLAEAAEVHVRLADRSIRGELAGEVLSGPEATSANSFECPDLVVPTPLEGVRIVNGEATFELPPLSFGALSLSLG